MSDPTTPNPEDAPTQFPERPPDGDETLPFRQPPELPQGRIPTVPGYEILGEVGRGGMGVVYKAKHLELKRVVALKMILSGEFAGPAELARFLAEAGVIANLRHEYVVQVFDCGQHEGRPFFSMEYLDGGSLDSRLHGEPLQPDPAAQILERLALAVHHAHQKGIVHRDLKPANVLIDSDGKPKLTDFGLAKQTDADGTRLTASKCVMGTPSYMAPEQASEAKHVGPAADVYGLGAILYELLTGRPPFRAATPLDTIQQVIERDPAPPRLINPSVPRELELICLKCLEKRPEDRYGSAEELAEDLRRYLGREPISARSYGVMSRLGRALERSHQDVEFGPWGNIFLWFALVIVAAESLGMLLLTWGGPPFPHMKVILLRVVQFLILGWIFWRYRRGRLIPASLAERQLYSVWIGYLLGSWVMPAVDLLLRRDGIVSDAMLMYPYWCLLSGMGFFAMGGGYWGRCYLLGLGFFATAVVISLNLRLGPLIFGAAWGAALTVVGLHLRSVARSQGGARADRGLTQVDPNP